MLRFAVKIKRGSRKRWFCDIELSAIEVWDLKTARSDVSTYLCVRNFHIFSNVLQRIAIAQTSPQLASGLQIAPTQKDQAPNLWTTAYSNSRKPVASTRAKAWDLNRKFMPPIHFIWLTFILETLTARRYFGNPSTGCWDMLRILITKGISKAHLYPASTVFTKSVALGGLPVLDTFRIIQRLQKQDQSSSTWTSYQSQ